MLLILEGPDGAGKTALAKKLAPRAKVHREGPPPDVRSLSTYYWSLVMAAKGPTVFDRLAMSEVVYGPIVRGISLIPGPEFTRFEAAVERLGARTIICLPPYQACLMAWAAKRHMGGELIKEKAQFDEVYDRYADFARTGRYLVYDRTRE